MNSQTRPTTTHQRGRRLSLFILLFLAVLLLATIAVKSGYADPAIKQRTSVPSISKPAAPSACGTISFSNNSYYVGMRPSDVKTGDLNGDGKLDLVTPNYNSANTSVLLGNGNGTFMTTADYASGDSSNSIAIGDFFGDRVDDLAVANLYTGGMSYLQGAGDGTFFPPYNFVMGTEPAAVVLADFNGDSYLDIATTGNYNVSIRLNDGIGDFAAATQINLGAPTFDLVTGDFNGDSKADLATTNQSSNSISVLMGNGNGTFQSPINFPTGNTPFGLTIGDFNGDGSADIATANHSVNTVSVLLNNGNGLFQGADFYYVQSEPYDVAVGDFNDDGKPDLVSANHGANSVSILLGSGNGSFYDEYNFSAGTGTGAVIVGDFNADGKDDIATANFTANTVSVLLNTCVSPTNTPTPTSAPTNTPLPTQTPGGPTATPSACAIQFTDVPSTNTFYQYVRCLACRGIISGYLCGGQGEPCNANNDPYFRPSSPVSRGQLAKIVSNAAGYTDPASNQLFEDVLPGSSFYTFVQRLAIHEVMGGYPCGGPGEPCGTSSLPYFRPSAGATRGQLTKIVSNAAAFTDPAPSTYTFADVPAGSTFHAFVERLLLNRPGAIGGYACGGASEPCDSANRPYFRPSSPLTRGQTSKIIGNTFYPNCQTPGR